MGASLALQNYMHLGSVLPQVEADGGVRTTDFGNG